MDTKKVYVIVEVFGDIKAVYEDEAEAIKVVDKWNKMCEKRPSWQVHYEEVNYFERGR